MEWYQVHYRVGEQWFVCREECGNEGRFNFETFARRRANTIMACGWAVEAMIVRVSQAQYSHLETRQVLVDTAYSVVLPLLV